MAAFDGVEATSTPMRQPVTWPVNSESVAVVVGEIVAVAAVASLNVAPLEDSETA